jgi:hypothetical protein
VLLAGPEGILVRTIVAMAPPDKFAAALRAAAHKINEVRARLSTGRWPAGEAAGRLEDALQGSSQPPAESAVEQSRAAVERVDEAIALVDYAAKELAAYMAQVLGDSPSMTGAPRSPPLTPERASPSGSPTSDPPSRKPLRMRTTRRSTLAS